MASGPWIGIPQASTVEQSLNWFGRTGSGVPVWKNLSLSNRGLASLNFSSTPPGTDNTR